jgi:hypothetical protein
MTKHKTEPMLESTPETPATAEETDAAVTAATESQARAADAEPPTSPHDFAGPAPTPNPRHSEAAHTFKYYYSTVLAALIAAGKAPTDLNTHGLAMKVADQMQANFDERYPEDVAPQA